MKILIKIFFHIISFVNERKTVGLLIFLFTFLFSPQIIYSQYDNIKFSSLTVDDGLSEDKVYCALQDSKGFIWFGTGSGLNRYDGYNFKIYSYNPNKTGSISSNAIWCLYEDREGTLWIGTVGGGLNRYDRNLDLFTVYKNDPLDSNSIIGNTIRSIFEDSRGYLWIGTLIEGSLRGCLNRFDKRTGVFKHYKNNPTDSTSISGGPIWGICEDELGNLWLGASLTGLDKLDMQTGKFIHFRNNPEDSYSLSHDRIRCMYLDEFQNLWIGTWNGFNKLSLNEMNSEAHVSAKFKRYFLNQIGPFDSFISTICRDNNGLLWLGTMEGIAIFDPRQEQFITYSKNEYNGMLGNEIKSIFEDKSGIIWLAVGSYGPGMGKALNRGGINIFDRSRMRFKVHWNKPGLPNSLNVDIIDNLMQDKEGNLWMTNSEPSIKKWDKTDKNFKKITPHLIGETNIISLFIDSKNNFWVQKNPGNEIDKFNPVTKELVNYYKPPRPDSIMTLRTIYEDKKGFFWIGGFELYKYDSEMNFLKFYEHDENDPYSIDNGAIDFIFEDNDSNIWVVTRASGLNKLDTKSGEFTHYRNVPGDMNSISNNYVTAMYDDGKGNIWFATYGGGLNKFNKQSGTFTHITKENGFADDFMNSLLIDNQGNFWIGSNSGISKYNPNDGTIKNYGVEDGLQGKEFAGCFKAESGEMFFWGYNGLNTFYPDSIKDNLFIPPVVLTSFRLFNKEANLDSSVTYKNVITLPYDSNFFSFEFAALDYHNPERNRYAYKLEGFNNDWIYTDAQNRIATYTNLDPGHYTFRVKGSNNDGVWNEEGASIKIIILPPWWATWWSYGIYSLLGFGFLFVTWKLDLNRRIKNYRLKTIQAENERKTKELEEARKLQLSMLPKCVPKYPGLDIAAYMKTATEVGGDYYDFYMSDDGTLTTVIGDATGHGLNAGMMVAATKSLFQSLSASTKIVKIMRQLNNTLMMLKLQPMYMTLRIVRINNSHVEVTAAGMYPLLVYRNATKEIKEIESDGPPLGAIPGINYTSCEVELSEGDIILLMTDGLTERFNSEKEMVGDERVKQIIKKVTELSADEIIESLVKAGDEWGGERPQDDDITFVVIKKD